jgi:hypothetical protein
LGTSLKFFSHLWQDPESLLPHRQCVFEAILIDHYIEIYSTTGKLWGKNRTLLGPIFLKRILYGVSRGRSLECERYIRDIRKCGGE